MFNWFESTQLADPLGTTCRPSRVRGPPVKKHCTTLHYITLQRPSKEGLCFMEKLTVSRFCSLEATGSVNPCDTRIGSLSQNKPVIFFEDFARLLFYYFRDERLGWGVAGVMSLTFTNEIHWFFPWTSCRKPSRAFPRTLWGSWTHCNVRSIQLAWYKAVLFKTRPVQTAVTTSITDQNTPIELHSLRRNRVYFFYIKRGGWRQKWKRYGGRIFGEFQVCFVWDFTAIPQFFSPSSSSSLLFVSHLHTAVCLHMCVYSTYLETSHSRRFNYSECRIARSNVDFVTAKIVTRSVNLIQANSPHMVSLKYWHNAYFKTRSSYKISMKENSMVMLLYFAQSNKYAN
jgi:hypothetical protein